MRAVRITVIGEATEVKTVTTAVWGGHKGVPRRRWSASAGGGVLRGEGWCGLLRSKTGISWAALGTTDWYAQCFRRPARESPPKVGPILPYFLLPVTRSQFRCARRFLHLLLLRHFGPSLQQ